MNTIDELISVLKVIIGLGVTMRVIFCLIKMIYSEDELRTYNRKIINIVIFGIVSELCLAIKDIVMFYYK